MVEQEQPQPVAAQPMRPAAPVQSTTLRDGGFVLKLEEPKPQPPRREAPSDLDLWSGVAGGRNVPPVVPAAPVAAPAPAAVRHEEVPPTAQPEPTAPAPLAFELPQPAPVEEEPAPTADQSLGQCRLIGELLETYILLERRDGLLLVDKHAAHERILFEQLKKDNRELSRQVLLEPVSVRLSRDQYSAAIQHLDAFEALGFAAEDFGEGMLIIREVPLILPRADAAALAEEIAQSLADQNSDPTPELLDDLLHSVACRAAIKAGSHSHTVEQQAIIDMLDADPTLRTCPHGRPIAVALSKREIEKLFGRIV